MRAGSVRLHVRAVVLIRDKLSQGLHVPITRSFMKSMSTGSPSSTVYLLHFRLQVAKLHTLLQVLPMLLCRQVQFLLLFMKKLQQVLYPSGHVYISITKQLHTCRHGMETLEFN